MSRVKLLGVLPPDDSKLNGLDQIAGELLANPKQTHIVVGVVVNGRTTIDHVKTGLKSPAAQFVQIEVVLDGRDAAVVSSILAKARDVRNGDRVLPVFDETPDEDDIDL